MIATVNNGEIKGWSNEKELEFQNNINVSKVNEVLDQFIPGTNSEKTINAIVTNIENVLVDAAKETFSRMKTQGNRIAMTGAMTGASRSCKYVPNKNVVRYKREFQKENQKHEVGRTQRLQALYQQCKW